MAMTFTRDGKVVEYDEKERDPDLRWIGDPVLIAEMRAALNNPSVTDPDTGLVIDLIEDNPTYNATAAAMVLGFDLVQAAPGTEEALELDLTSFPTVLDELFEMGIADVSVPVSTADQWSISTP